MTEIHFDNTEQLAAPAVELVYQWANSTLSSEGQSGAELSIVVVSEADSQQLNHQFRNQNKPTNVLSFPADIPDHLGLKLLGDVIICADIVAREAKTYQVLPEQRWAHMVAHGILHLLGYDHIAPQDAQIMEAKETQLLNSWGYNDPYTSLENHTHT